MAYFRKTPKGYQAQIEIKGVRKSKTFPTKREAQAWAHEEEAVILTSSATAEGERTSLKQVLDRYSREVSPTRRGKRWEQIRLNALADPRLGLPVDLPIARIKPEHFAAFRDSRLASVSDGTVLRELGLLSAVMATARREWRLISGNPVADIRKPSSPKHRDRLIKPGEIRAMLTGFGYAPQKPVKSISESIAVCFLLALRTGMRAGELCNLKWVDVHARHVHLGKTKNGQERDVPLSKKAVALVQRMQGFDKVYVFGLTTQTLDAMFRKIRKRQGLEGFTFHDSRHTAATWIAGRLKSNRSVTAQQALLDLCKIFGWTDTARALVYYNPDPGDMASRLD